MPGRQFFSAYGRQAGVVLIRPDGYIGWRGRSCLERTWRAISGRCSDLLRRCWRGPAWDSLIRRINSLMAWF